nr:MAG TPA: hypothetical protein [Caudoviricetes sp.]DAT35820.1 MAG TPA: hypothetical protein [Caudoviricetes sp.]
MVDWPRCLSVTPGLFVYPPAGLGFKCLSVRLLLIAFCNYCLVIEA